MLSLMVAAPMLFGCDMTAAAPAAEAVQEAVEEKAEEVTTEVAEAVEEQAEEVQEAVEEQVEEVAEAVEEAVAPGKMDELTEINFFTSNNKSASNEKVKELEDAINAISEPEINVHVNLITADSANYRTQMPLALASGESYDLVFMMPMPPINLTAMYSASQLMDISPYLEQYGPDILDVAGKYLDAVTVNGGIYMIPNIRNYASAEWWVIGQKYIDEAGLKDDFFAVETVDDVEAICEKLYDQFGIPVFAGAKNEDSMIQYHGTGGELLASSGSYEENTLVIDNLGDNLYVLAVDPETDTVYNIYDTEEFVESCKKNQEWYDKGWIYKDSAFSEESQETICKNGAAMSIVVTSELGVEANKQASFNMPVYAVKFKNALVTSGVVSRFGLGVPSTAAEPEAAVAFANLLYTNGDLNNILDWGIEGKDWELVDGEAAYIGGDADNAEWHQFAFAFGNLFVSTPWQGEGADNRIRSKEENDAAEVSKYLGFVLNTDELQNIVTALFSVTEEYKYQLALGSWDEAKYQEYLQKLKDAGVDEYIAAAQAQLDEWLANK